MGENVEVKARTKDPEKVRLRVEALCSQEGEVIRQEDCFYSCAHGRLKLRRFPSDSGELIFYRRPDQSGPKLSRYSIAPVNDPAALHQTLSQALGCLGSVRKTRRLYRLGQTRIHLDQVDGLGHFLELEVVLRPGQPMHSGERIAKDLLDRLDIPQESLIESAYFDLLDAPENASQEL